MLELQAESAVASLKQSETSLEQRVQELWKAEMFANTDKGLHEMDVQRYRQEAERAVLRERAEMPERARLATERQSLEAALARHRLTEQAEQAARLNAAAFGTPEEIGRYGVSGGLPMTRPQRV